MIEPREARATRREKTSCRQPSCEPDPGRCRCRGMRMRSARGRPRSRGPRTGLGGMLRRLHPCRMTETDVADDGTGHRRDQPVPPDGDHRVAAVARRLADAIGGPVGVPGDAAYETARQTFNGILDRRPALTVGCSTTADVRLAVGAAADAGLPVAVRGGSQRGRTRCRRRRTRRRPCADAHRRG